MKLSAAAVYALQALVYLARNEGGWATAETMARGEGMSEVFLRKALGSLVSAGVLLSRRGLDGGYRLCRPAKAVALLDVVEAVDGPIRGDVPRWTTAPADARLDGRLQRVCDTVAEAVRKRLRRVNIADLAEGEG
jgi:Rrf2 family protein